MHKWENLDTQRSGRMLFVLLDVAPLMVAGEKMEEFLGDLAPEYAHAN